MTTTSLFPEKTTVLRIALPVPLRRLFDYLPPADVDTATLVPGVRVRVPFGRQQLIGILMDVTRDSDVPTSKLRPALAIIDSTPPLPPVLFELVQWAAQYYQYPLGDVLASVLPATLREGGALSPVQDQHWRLVPWPDHGLRSGSKQLDLYLWLQERISASRSAILAAGFSAATFKALVDKELLEAFTPDPQLADPRHILAEPELALNDEQQVAVSSIKPGEFQASLLEGVTGSGKTEVYLQLIAKILARGEQAMVLVPEIGLTPQTVARFQRRFQCPVAVMHSGLADGARFASWRKTASGEAGILIGTRSALFTPLARPGIIIVDEEHDSSFKQQDGFRYSARDLAVLRAQRENIPVVLGSATPSLETLYNAIHDRYQYLRLTHRAGNARAPTIEVIDTNRKPLAEGMTHELLEEIRMELARGNQVLAFLNRRGYAPAITCADCRWHGACPNCSAKMTVHKKAQLLRCHHCDYQEKLPSHCPSCGSTRLDYIGIGTQRSEQFLAEQFAEFPVLRIDRDSMSRKHALDDMLKRIHTGDPCLLIGTQMLAKGHHFPHVTLVVILDIDSGLFSADFRGPEKMGQLLEQVAGRAGRAEKPGRVLIQSKFAEHPLLQTLLQDGYQRLARLLLAERQVAALPPYYYMALLRAEHADPYRAQTLLREWREQLKTLCGNGVHVAGPFPASMEKRAGFYRLDLQIKSDNRMALQKTLSAFCEFADQQKIPADLRWSLDVDPAG
ncbi:MAG TPA: primosomal protein N' [Pseudomonadales bacterium]|nr:primosomal protein N' [Pseudomonadales bacterium]